MSLNNDDDSSSSKKGKKRSFSENESDITTSPKKKHKAKKNKSHIVHLENALSVNQEPQNEYSKDLFLDDDCLKTLFSPVSNNSHQCKELNSQEINNDRNDSEIEFYNKTKLKKKHKNGGNDIKEEVGSVQNRHSYGESSISQDADEMICVKNKKKKIYKTVSADIDIENNEKVLDDNYFTKRKKHKLHEDSFSSDSSYFDTSDVQSKKQKYKNKSEGRESQRENNEDELNKRKHKKKNKCETKLENSYTSTDYSMTETSAKDTTVTSFKDCEIENDSDQKQNEVIQTNSQSQEEVNFSDNSGLKKKKKHKTASADVDTENDKKMKKHKGKLHEDGFLSDFDASDVQPIKNENKSETEESNNSDSQKENNKDDLNKRRHKRKNKRKTVNSFKEYEIGNDSERKKLKKKHKSQEILDDLFTKMKESTFVAEPESVSSTSDNTIEVLEDTNNDLNISCDSLNDKRESKKNFNGESRKTQIHKEIREANDFQDLPDLLNSEELIEIPPEHLKNLSVTLPWHVPLLHTLETTISGNPNQKIRKDMQDLDVKIKTGTFSTIEDQQIIRNWHYFCKLHDLPNNPTPFANNIRKSQIPILERLKFVRFLAHGLDDRLLNAVYKRFQRIFRIRTLKCGKFTPEEDEIIKTYMASSKSSTPWADLAKSLGRDTVEIRRRFIYFQDQALVTKNRYKWNNKEDIKKLVKNVLKVTKLNKIEDLKERKLTHKEFKKLSKKLDYPVDKLRAAWSNTIYPRLFLKDNLNTSYIRSSLINRLIERGETDLRTINWEEIAKDYEGLTSKKLCKIFRSILNYYVPREKHHNLSMCLIYLEKFGQYKSRTLIPLDIDDISD